MKRPSDPLKTCAFAVLLAGLPATALALDDGVFTPSVFAGYRYDSNLFRVSDDSDSSTRGSANTKSFGVGLQIVKAFGLQKFRLDTSITRQLYSKYTSLDATSKTIDTGLAWKLTPAFGGNLIYRRSEVPNNFADVGFESTKNLRTTEERRADFDYRPGAALHPQISVFENISRSERPTFQQEDSTTRSVMASLIYTFASQNSLEGYVRKANGSYENFVIDPTQQLATEFREVEEGIRYHWNYSGTTSLNGSLGHVKRTHSGVDIRNFSGLVGQASFAYQLTGKTKLEVNADRFLYSSQSTISSYVAQTDFAFAPNWSVTNQVTVRPSWTYQRRVFKGAPALVGTPLTQYIRAITLDVVWSPLRSVDVTASFSHEKRSATLPGLDYLNNSAQLYGRYHF